MPGTVRCPQCGSNLKYSTPSPPPRAKCPKCGNVFEPAADAAITPSEARAAQPQVPIAPTLAAPPAGPAFTPVAPLATTWYYARGGVRFGPFDEATIRQMAASGALRRDDYVWNETMSDWTEAARVAALFAPGVPGALVAAGYAGFWLRLVALIIDQLLLCGVGLVIGFIVGFTVAAAGGDQVAATVLAQIVAVLVTWLYYALSESSSWQATLGKKALGLAVTDLDGKRISFWRATGRHFAKLLSAFILFIGFIMAGFTEKKQALHDMIAGCLVVRTR